MSFIYNQSLKTLNTFGIEASAQRFSRCGSIEELVSILDEWKKKKDNLLILGGGSNILFTKDFEGTVLKNELMGIEVVKENENHIWVKAGAGEVWHDLVMYCVKNNFAGIENMALIPGCVGAAPMQNIGAYGVELKDVFESLDALKIEDNSICNFDLEACEFGYRESVFKRKYKNQYIILSVVLKLSKKPEFKTSYGTIQQQLKENGIQNLSIQAIADAVIQIRRSKLPDPVEIGNAGSFFKNPEITNEKFYSLKENFPDIVGYPVGDLHTKLAAGWLIEKAGWKGKTFENFGVHKHQALVLVNYGGAKGEEIYALSGQIIEAIRQKFGVELEREVNIY